MFKKIFHRVVLITLRKKRPEFPVCLPSNTNAEITMKRDIGNENARNKKKIVP